jgi:hypothetical protein
VSIVAWDGQSKTGASRGWRLNYLEAAGQALLSLWNSSELTRAAPPRLVMEYDRTSVGKTFPIGM